MFERDNEREREITAFFFVGFHQTFHVEDKFDSAYRFTFHSEMSDTVARVDAKEERRKSRLKKKERKKAEEEERKNDARIVFHHEHKRRYNHLSGLLWW